MAANTTASSDVVRGKALPVAAFGAVLDAMDCAIVVVDRNGMILSNNAIARDMLSPGDTLSTALARINVSGDFPGWADLPRMVVAAGRVVSWDAVQVGGAHSIEPEAVVVCCAAFKDASSGTSGVVVRIDGREPLVSSPEASELSRRLTALGKLASQVAHELNNPLDGILRYLNLSLRLTSGMPESKLQSYLSESRAGVMRMVHVVSELLEFSRSTDGEFDESDINEIVEQAIRATTGAIESKGIVVTADFQSQTMPTVRGSRLYQVCCNLIKNGIDAMPDGGRLTITTGLVGQQVIIRVADTGVGLPEDTEKMFEAFYTTKPSGAGTGLGLAICKDFIEDMGGTISVAPGQDGGAVFTVQIPSSVCGRSPRGRGGGAGPGST